jgi:hypothetical protein
LLETSQCIFQLFSFIAFWLLQDKVKPSDQGDEAKNVCEQTQPCEKTEQVEDDTHNSDLDSVEMEIIDDVEGDEGLVVLNEVACEVTAGIVSSNGKSPGKCIDYYPCKFFCDDKMQLTNMVIICQSIEKPNLR